MAKMSIIIPLYNKEQDFPLTLQSVLAQGFSDFEVIIVNDGSTDNSLAIAEAAAKKDPRIKIFNKKNEGLAATRNFGVAKATAEHVVFIDADDYWHPFHLENMNAILTKFPDAPWFGAAYEKKYNENLVHTMVSPLSKKDADWMGQVNFFENSLADSLVHPSSFGMKKNFFLDLGGHDTGITFAEDTDLWIRAALREPVAFSNTISAVIMLNTSNRINHSSAKSRIYPNFDRYESEAQNNAALKKYLDVHRFSIALHYKLAGDLEHFKRYREKIAPSNLNRKQTLLLHLPRTVLLASKTLKEWLHNSGFYFSIYK